MSAPAATPNSAAMAVGKLSAMTAFGNGFLTRLGRIPMYRLLTYLLLALAVVAAVFSVTGKLTFPIRALAETAAVLVAVSFVSNRLFAALFRVDPHSESSLITAGILFFILSPTVDATTLAEVALAAAFASASKYVLAVRGRHVFNPAAVGAVWLAVFRMPLALWWIGAPTLLPFVVVAAVLIVVRVRKTTPVVVFVVLAVAGTTIRSVDSQTFGAALTFTVQQTPIVFLAGFMLTEPFTLPPRRWQQIVVAAIVAGLVAFPAHLADFTVGPETALVIGNAVAFGFGQRRTIELKLAGRTVLSAGTIEFTFVPTRPVRFAAGQYVELDVPHRHTDRRGQRRTFSIASAPTQNDVRIAMRIPTDRPSSFKAALDDAPVGTLIRGNTVAGDFTLPRDPAIPVLLVAGGIGITPFLSHLQTHTGRDVVVMWAAGRQPEPAYLEQLEASAARIVLVDADHPLDDGLLRENVPDIARRHVYISGAPAFVNTAGRYAHRLKAARVHRDQFAGY